MQKWEHHGNTRHAKRCWQYTLARTVVWWWRLLYRVPKQKFWLVSGVTHWRFQTQASPGKFWWIVLIAYHRNSGGCDIAAPPCVSPAQVTWQLWNRHWCYWYPVTVASTSSLQEIFYFCFIFILDLGLGQCQDHRTINHGFRILNGTTEGSTVVFGCNEEFDLLGNQRLTCGSNGLWTGSWPTCVKSEYTAHQHSLVPGSSQEPGNEATSVLL